METAQALRGQKGGSAMNALRRHLYYLATADDRYRDPRLSIASMALLSLLTFLVALGPVISHG